MTREFRWPGAVVLDEVEIDDIYQVQVELIATPTHCPHCENAELVSFGRRAEVLHDVPHHGKPCRISLSRRRYRCKACRRAFLEPVPHKAASRQMTSRLVRYITRVSARQSYSGIAATVGVHEKTIRNIVAAAKNNLNPD